MLSPICASGVWDLHLYGAPYGAGYAHQQHCTGHCWEPKDALYRCDMHVCSVACLKEASNLTLSSHNAYMQAINDHSTGRAIGLRACIILCHPSITMLKCRPSTTTAPAVPSPGSLYMPLTTLTQGWATLPPPAAYLSLHRCLEPLLQAQPCTTTPTTTTPSCSHHALTTHRSVVLRLYQ